VLLREPPKTLIDIGSLSTISYQRLPWMGRAAAHPRPARLRSSRRRSPRPWLRDRHAYNAGDIATRAIEAATAQRTTVIGQDVAASVVARLAQTVLDINAELVEVDAPNYRPFKAGSRR
jgi:hypothetical protein